MVIIKSIKQKSDDGVDAITPESSIPVGYKVRFIGGEFQAIPQNEEWQDEPVKP